MNVLHSFDAGYIAHFFDKKNAKCEILNKKSAKTRDSKNLQQLQF